MIYHKPLAEIIEFDDSDIVVASGTHRVCALLTWIDCHGGFIGVAEDVPNKPEKKRVSGPEADPFANF